jgi:hypothetical protein
MMIDYEEIFKAWKASIKPTPKQEEHAQKRLDVCLGCDYRKEVLKGVKWSAYCGACGCPINKKIFSSIFNACTKNKWGDVDSEYLDVVPDKEKKSII